MCFFFKQKTAYEMRFSDWSSDVCSSDLFGLTGNLRIARRHAGCEHDVVVLASEQMLCADARAELHLHAGRFELATEVAQRLVKLFLAGHALGHVELAADFARRIEQFDGVTTLGEQSRGREAGRGEAGRAAGRGGVCTYGKT